MWFYYSGWWHVVWHRTLYFGGASGSIALPVIPPGQATCGMTGQMHLQYVGIAACVTLWSRWDTWLMGKISVLYLWNKCSYTTEERVTIQDLTFAKAMTTSGESDVLQVYLTYTENMN